MPLLLHVPPKSKSKRAGSYQDQLIRWAEERARQGVPRQTICDALLRAPDISLDSFLHLPPDQRDVCLEDKGSRIKAAREIAQVMVNRDLSARALEREGRLSDAIRLYEANLSDKCSAVNSYDRLRVLYTEQGDIQSAIRVCYAYLMVAKNSADAEAIQQHLYDLVTKRDLTPLSPACILIANTAG